MVKILQVETGNLYTPRFWEAKTRATRGYGRWLGLPLSTHGPNERYCMRPTSVAISTYMVQNWHFSIFCCLLLNS